MKRGNDEDEVEHTRAASVLAPLVAPATDVWADNVLAPLLAARTVELARFGVPDFGAGVDATALDVDAMVRGLDALLRHIMREGTAGRVSAVKWQAAEGLCAALCGADQEAAVHRTVATVLREESAEVMEMFHSPVATRRLATCFSPQMRKEFLFSLMVLNSCGGRAVPVEVKLKIFLLSRIEPPDARRGCNAVLASCAVIDKKWVPNQRTAVVETPILWDEELLQQVAPNLGPLLVEPVVSCDYLLLARDAEGRAPLMLRDPRFMCGYLRRLSRHCGTETAIMLPVDPKLVEKLACFVAFHNSQEPSADDDDDERRTDNIGEWDLNFCAVDQRTLFEMILMAQRLEVPELVSVACKTVANMIKGKSPEEIRATFNIRNDFTPEEEEQVRKENEWCEER